MMSAVDLRRALQCDRPRCRCHSPRGPLHCPAHADKTPSFDVVQRGRVLVVCRSGCRQENVIEALRARGLWSTPASPAPRRPLTLQEEILEVARREPWARPGVVCSYFVSDFIRRTHRRADELRRHVTAFGIEAAEWPSAWRVLEIAANGEREAHRREHELDDILEPRT